MQKILFTLLKLIAKTCYLTLLALIVIVLFSVAAPYIKNIKSHSYIHDILNYEQWLRTQLRAYILTDSVGKGWQRLILIVVAFISAHIFSRIADYFSTLASYHQYKSELNNLKEKLSNSESYASLGNKLEELKSSSKKDREGLLKEFLSLKKELDSSGRELAFLSIDVVGSTEMKQGEEPTVIEYDFKMYRHFVEEILSKHNCIKATWTPDGVMCCFATVDETILTAKGIINGLDDFNRNIKNMKSDFRVRCGINSGFLYFDESAPLEQISDRVIDIAGHMQKYAQPNTINIAKSSVEPLVARDGIQPSGKEIDGYEVYEWKK